MGVSNAIHLRIARAQIKVLEQALKFAEERERQLRDRLKYNSARYSEGGSGEYIWPKGQRVSRVWNATERKLEDVA